MEIQEESGPEESLAANFLTVAIAVNGSKNSLYAVRWALDKFVPEGRTLFRLLHVRPTITMVPTPMGNYLHISKVREDVASAYRKEMEWKANSLLLPYKKMCAQKQVEAEAVILEENDVPEAIREEIAKFKICKLVIGASSRNILTRKIKGPKMSAKIAGCIPSFCTVYVVSKGKLSSARTATSIVDEIAQDVLGSSIPSSDYTCLSDSADSEWSDTDEMPINQSFRQASLSSQRNQALANINNKFSRTTSFNSACTGNVYRHDGSTTPHSLRSEAQSSLSSISSYKSVQSEYMSQSSDQASTSEVRSLQTDSSLSSSQALNCEIERLRIKLQHFQKVYESELADANRQVQELGILRTQEEIILKERQLREETAKMLARKERQEQEAAKREAQLVKVRMAMEAAHRKEAEDGAAREAYEKQTLERALACHEEEGYKRYTWEEIQSATSFFSTDRMIGRGANGTVYKGEFHHTIAAVKVLHSLEGYGNKQFKQELDVLSRIHHPHLLLLIGACPVHGCLVYEYMEYGSLDDRLQCKNNTPPLRWFDRYRIAWEIASALIFLHSSVPEPIIHRDLKPANILLNRNFVSKIGDVGLSTILTIANQPSSTLMIKNTAPVGTFCYIDPEYQRTGLVSVKSDVYALGMVMMQLLTARSPVGLAYAVERALEDGSLTNILDPKAGHWPLEETKELACLALSCAELKSKDRPNLSNRVLPALERLKEFANKAKDSEIRVWPAPPSHFICPILQEVMDDPHVASDGYTYDRKAIELWLSMNDKSPMTNLKLSDKNLIPNHSLRSAIMDWKSSSC